MILVNPVRYWYSSGFQQFAQYGPLMGYHDWNSIRLVGTVGRIAEQNTDVVLIPFHPTDDKASAALKLKQRIGELKKVAI